MARERRKHKGRGGNGHFTPVPHAVATHPDFIGLSVYAKALLFTFFPQIRFDKNGPANNGDFCATWSTLQPYGWRSKDTIAKALRELEQAEVLIRTRQGGRHQCSLYALSWLPINDCRTSSGARKLDVPPTTAPPVNWHRKGCPATRGSGAPSHGAADQDVANRTPS